MNTLEGRGYRRFYKNLGDANKVFFTSDTHFNSMEIIRRENRPFNNKEEQDEIIINNFNKLAKEKDIIFHLGDFINYNENDKTSWESSIKYPKRINADIILIIGNNEERLLKEIFNNDWDRFKAYLINCGFENVFKEIFVDFENIELYLNHYPKNYKKDKFNLFGHTHKTCGLFKTFGLNMGIDLNYFNLFTEKDLLTLMERKSVWWDKDEDTLIK